MVLDESLSVTVISVRDGHHEGEPPGDCTWDINLNPNFRTFLLAASYM